jgi:hypothetical protein
MWSPDARATMVKEIVEPLYQAIDKRGVAVSIFADNPALSERR